MAEFLVFEYIETQGDDMANYRAAAFKKYQRTCVICGFGIEAVLEVAHLDGDRSHCDLDNLAILCPTCHRMHDVGLIPTDVVKRMREHDKQARWSLLLKDGLNLSRPDGGSAIQSGARRRGRLGAGMNAGRQ